MPATRNFTAKRSRTSHMVENLESRLLYSAVVGITVSGSVGYDDTGSLPFDVFLSAPAATDITVNWQVAPNDQDPVHYSRDAGNTVIHAGDTTGFIFLPITQSDTWHPDEPFTLNISSEDADVQTPTVDGVLQTYAHFDAPTDTSVPEGSTAQGIQIKMLAGPDVGPVSVQVTKMDGGSPELHLVNGESVTDSFEASLDTSDPDSAVLFTPTSDTDDDTGNDTSTWMITAQGFAPITITVTQEDTTPVGPAAPNAPVLSADSDDGDSSDDNITSLNNSSPDTALTFTVGGVNDGDTVILFADGIPIGGAQADGDTATITTDGVTVLTQGEHSFTAAIATDGDPVFSDAMSVTVTTPTPVITLDPPANVVASDDSTDEINVSWDPVPNAAGYQVYRGTTSKFADADRLTDDGFSDITYDDFDGDPGVKYYYFILATNGDSESDPSTATTGIMPLESPGGLEATTDQPDQVDLSWDETNGAVSYNIFRSEGDDFSAAKKINKTAVTENDYADHTALGGHYYNYWVVAVGPGSTSDPSDEAAGQLGAADTTVSAPKPAATYTFGKAITLTSTFTTNPKNAPAPTGDFTIIDEDSTEIIADGTVKGKSATFSIASLPPGVYTCFVQFDGDDFHAAADSPDFTLTINPATTTTALKIAGATTVFGQDITLTATVKSISAPGIARTGDVTFYDGNDPIDAPVTLDDNSIATITFTPSTTGAHKFRAVYEGDDSFNTSTSPIATRNVAKAKTLVVITPSDPSPLHAGDLFDLTADVSVVAPGAGDPTGTITFRDNGKIVATVAAIDGEATLMNITYTKTGTHKFTATFNGDANDLLSNSALTMKILPALVQALPARG